MYFRQPNKKSTINVEDDFAHLRDVSEAGDMTFDLYYSVPMSAIVSKSAIINVSVSLRTIKPKPLFDSSHLGKIDAKALIGNILTQVQDAKNVAKQKDDFVVAVKNSDVSVKLNNEIIPELRAGIGAKDISKLQHQRLKTVQSSELKERAEKRPILQKMAHISIVDLSTIHSSSKSENVTSLMHDMIIRSGLDPTQLISLTHRSIPSTDAVRGTLRPTKGIEAITDSSVRLLNHHLFVPEVQISKNLTTDVEDEHLVHVMMPVVKSNAENKATVVIKRKSLFFEGKEQGMLQVKFEMVDPKTDLTVDVVTKQLDVAKHLKIRNTPTKAPIVKLSRSEVSTRINIEITQVDPIADAIHLLRKDAFGHSPGGEEYEFLGTFDVSKKQRSLLIQVQMPRTLTSLYRVIPVVKNGAVSSEFSNVVVKPARFTNLKLISLVASNTPVGVKLEARNIPQHVVSIEFLGRNRTNFTKEYENIGGTIFFIDSTVRELDYVSVIDNDVSSDNIYEYVVKAYYRSGTTDISGHALIEFSSPNPGKVDTNVVGMVTSQSDGLDVTFDVSSKIADSQLQSIKDLLKKHDVYDLFKDEVKNERNSLNELIACNVERVNVTTGERESFGTFTGTNFSDKKLRESSSVKPLKQGNKYRYEVQASVRTPETLFDEFVKEVVDPVTKKTYSFKPSKFLHPIVLNKGVITSNVGLKTKYTKDAMSHGLVGSMSSIEISFENERPNILDVVATKFDRFLNTVSWKMSGNSSLFDHFLVFKEIANVRTLVGKAHAGSSNVVQFLHKVTIRDEGPLRYVVVPVLGDYRLGEAFSSNVVVVDSEPARLDK